MFGIITYPKKKVKEIRNLKITKYHKRDPIKNYFPMPNEVFALGLRAEEIAIYSYLMFCEDRETYTCYPSYKNIGRALNMTTNTVRKYVNSLKEKELIETEKTEITRQDGKKYNGNLKYTILPIETAVRSYQERILEEMELRNKLEECKKNSR